MSPLKTKKKKKSLNCKNFPTVQIIQFWLPHRLGQKNLQTFGVLNKKKVKRVNNSNPKPLQIHTYTAQADTSPQTTGARRGSYSHFTYFSTKSLIAQYTFLASFSFLTILLFLLFFVFVFVSGKIYVPLILYFGLVSFSLCCQPNFLGFLPQTQQTWAKAIASTDSQYVLFYIFIYVCICMYWFMYIYI